MSEANDEAKAKVAEHLFSKVKRSSELRSETHDGNQQRDEQLTLQQSCKMPWDENGGVVNRIVNGESLFAFKTLFAKPALRAEAAFPQSARTHLELKAARTHLELEAARRPFDSLQQIIEAARVETARVEAARVETAEAAAAVAAAQAEEAAVATGGLVIFIVNGDSLFNFKTLFANARTCGAVSGLRPFAKAPHEEAFSYTSKHQMWAQQKLLRTLAALQHMAETVRVGVAQTTEAEVVAEAEEVAEAGEAVQVVQAVDSHHFQPTIRMTRKASIDQEVSELTREEVEAHRKRCAEEENAQRKRHAAEDQQEQERRAKRIKVFDPEKECGPDVFKCPRCHKPHLYSKEGGRSCNKLACDNCSMNFCIKCGQPASISCMCIMAAWARHR